MERTCLIVKPDGVGKKVVGEIVKRLENEGLKLIGLKMLRPTREQIEGFYEVHRGKPFFPAFIGFMTSGPIVVSAWEGKEAVSLVRSVIGDTNSKEAAPGTLRNLYGTDNRRNLVHASDSKENGQREIAYFFRPDEVLKYDPDAWVNT
ncbi:MAG: nucleoside-diphosphate kinase [Endomicrobiales bacterium]